MPVSEPRAPKIFRIPGQQRIQGSKWVSTPLPDESRQQREDRQWRDTFEKFRDIWADRTSDHIERGHPFEFWVWKQRKKYRDGSLAPWRHQLLDSIAFPLQAARIQEQTGNMMYARRLHRYYLQNGHYAPTIRTAGSALTHWTRKMRQSNGTSGILSDGPGEAEKASNYLSTHISDFDWHKTIKSTHNFRAGLTHNGYRPSLHIKHGSRAQDVIHRARASKAFRYRPEVTDDEALCDTPLHEFLLKCAFYEQAARVHLTGVDDKDPQWWLEDLEFSETSENQMTFYLARLTPDPRTHDPVIQRTCVDFRCDGPQEAGYTDDGGLFIATLYCPNGKMAVTLDMDVPLADQTHRGVHPLQWRTEPWWTTRTTQVDWNLWSNPKTFPAKCASASSTANAAFTQNLGLLRDHLARHHATEDCPVHIGFGSLPLFKFLEHMQRKLQNGISQPSHMERLSELHFTWGEHKANAIQLFSREADLSGCAFSIRAAMHPDQGHGLNIDSPRKFDSIRHARLFISALEQKAKRLGRPLNCSADTDDVGLWSYFYAVGQHRDRLIIEYTPTYWAGAPSHRAPMEDIN